MPCYRDYAFWAKKLEMITPIRGRKPTGQQDSTYKQEIRNDNPDKGTETKSVALLPLLKMPIRNDNPDKGTETYALCSGKGKTRSTIRNDNPDKGTETT